MATYIGYNTINQIKKHTLTDTELVKRDFLNSLNIRQGEVPGRPEVGTTIWNNVFDPNTNDVLRQIKAEINRLIDYDPRITAEEINVTSQSHTVIIEVNVRIIPNLELETIRVFFDEGSNLASLG